MKPRLKKMWELAIEEAKNLREHLTPEEKGRILVANVNPIYETECIYGRLTGNCYSERANELIIQCCEKVYVVKRDTGIADGVLNGLPYRTPDRETSYCSPIETLIHPDNAGEQAIKKLVPFIKGETKRITIPVK